MKIAEQMRPIWFYHLRFNHH